MFLNTIALVSTHKHAFCSVIFSLTFYTRNTLLNSDIQHLKCYTAQLTWHDNKRPKSQMLLSWLVHVTLISFDIRYMH